MREIYCANSGGNGAVWVFEDDDDPGTFYLWTDNGGIHSEPSAPTREAAARLYELIDTPKWLVRTLGTIVPRGL